MDRRVHVYGEAKSSSDGAVAKASLKVASSRARAARNPVIYPWPGCTPRNRGGRTEAVNVEKFWHELRGGVKV
jgi:hypothetical protein